MHLKDYLYMMLTGDALSDASDQSLVFLDMEKREYDKRLFDLYGLSEYIGRYPKVAECAETAAPLSKEAAAATGLPEGVVITNGPMDVADCALGAGVVESGDCCSIIGTAALHEMVIDKPCNDTIYAGMTVCHAMSDKWLRLMASLAGTPNIEWLFGLLGAELTTKASAEGRDIYAYVERLVGASPIGANGIMYHPYLLAGGERAPFFAPAARASFTGISINHGAPDMLRACYEGVAYAMMDCYMNMPLEARRVTLCGGGAKSAMWSQMFADAVGRDVVTVNGEELGAKGCFIANAYAQGIFGSYYEGAEKTVSLGRTYHTDGDRHDSYSKYYRLYKQTYAALTDTWKLRQEILFENM
jgi:sugar (pentulose or hexulose) kinase